MNRREFLGALPLLGSCAVSGLEAAEATTLPDSSNRRFIHTVSGRKKSTDMGSVLTHEHVLVDFRGAAYAQSRPYDRTAVSEVILPHLKAAYAQGFRTLLECTPNFLGRDPELLRRLSQMSRLHIVTNTA